MRTTRLSPEALRATRIGKGLSINGLARKAGVSAACVSRLESVGPGRRAGRPETWALLADALECELVELLKVEEAA